MKTKDKDTGIKGARHSLYKHPKKWEKATESQKVRSVFQRRINHYKKKEARLLFELKVSKVKIIGLEQAINWATESGKVKRGEFKPFLKTKAQIKKELSRK